MTSERLSPAPDTGLSRRTLIRGAAYVVPAVTIVSMSHVGAEAASGFPGGGGTGGAPGTTTGVEPVGSTGGDPSGTTTGSDPVTGGDPTTGSTGGGAGTGGTSGGGDTGGFGGTEVGTDPVPGTTGSGATTTGGGGGGPVGALGDLPFTGAQVGLLTTVAGAAIAGGIVAQRAGRARESAGSADEQLPRDPVR